MFEEERRRIEAVTGSWLERIEHVGSTAVPDLAAKPVIDIMVGVDTLESGPLCVEALTGIGYEYVPEFERELPERRYLRKFGPDGRRTHQIHLVEHSDYGWWDRHVAFRDHLRAHPDIAAEYTSLKRGLAGRFRHDRASYTDAKTKFVRRIELQARG
jgi:GrpB-like predicted nucleotidyltransferase (UPF0157 family)